MIFSLVVILAVLAIAYFHYTQGLFSAFLSALFVVIAALMAVSYHEPLVSLLNRGGISDLASGISLVVLFALIYTILRFLFDSLVPGNVLCPLWVDRIGAGVMGLIAGLFATGVVALAAQTMPLGASIAGYARYSVQDRENVEIPSRGGGQNREGPVGNEMIADQFTPEEKHSLFPPVDELLLDLVSHLSDGGSLDNNQPFQASHPDYLQELFGNRVGIQTGAKHTAPAVAGTEQLQVEGLWVFSRLAQVDADAKQTRPAGRIVAPELRAGEGDVILVVRALFQKDSTDKSDNLFRFSPGAARLLLPINEEGQLVYRNFYPVGTYDKAAERVFANRADDPLLVPITGEPRADLVYLVPKSVLALDAKNAPQWNLPQGSFLEVKRLARVELEEKPVMEGSKLTASDKVAVLRKPGVAAAPTPAPAPPATKPR